jgi:hypothetical protein
MINRKLLRTLTLALALLSVANIVAFANDSRNLTVHNPATLSGVQLAVGQYKVSWKTHSPEVAGQYQGNHNSEVTVTFTKGNKVMATAQGKLVPRDANYNRDAVIYRTNPDGSLTITELRFKNMKQVIVFNQ